MTFMHGTINRFTDAQREVLANMFNPHIPARGTAHNEILSAYEIVDDLHVRCYNIHPDGRYFVETLENGLGAGWTMRDMFGSVIKDAPEWFKA